MLLTRTVLFGAARQMEDERLQLTYPPSGFFPPGYAVAPH